MPCNLASHPNKKIIPGPRDTICTRGSCHTSHAFLARLLFLSHSNSFHSHNYTALHSSPHSLPLWPHTLSRLRFFLRSQAVRRKSLGEPYLRQAPFAHGHRTPNINIRRLKSAQLLTRPPHTLRFATSSFQPRPRSLLVALRHGTVRGSSLQLASSNSISALQTPAVGCTRAEAAEAGVRCQHQGGGAYLQLLFCGQPARQRLPQLQSSQWLPRLVSGPARCPPSHHYKSSSCA